MFFKKNNPYENDYNSSVSNKTSEKNVPNGLIIHFTPVAIYVYTAPEFESFNDGYVVLYDDKGRTIELGGTIICHEVSDQEEVESILERYQISQSAIRVIRIPLNNFTE